MNYLLKNINLHKLGIGIASLVVPVYLAESSARKIRGAIVSLNVCFITFG